MQSWLEMRVWHEDTDIRLSAVCKEFHALLSRAESTHDHFAAYFSKELEELTKDLREVLLHDHMTVNRNHFLWKENVLYAFQNDDSDKTWRFTWFLNDDELLFDEPVWKAYFEQITSVLMKRKIVTTVRTLFIIEDQQGHGSKNYSGERVPGHSLASWNTADIRRS
jgi:hypothetical protein